MWRAALTKKLKTVSLPLVVGVFCLLASTTAVIAYYRHTTTHLPPNVYVNSVNIGNLTYPEAEQTLLRHSSTPDTHLVTLSVDGITVASESAALGLSYNYKKVLDTLKNNATRGRMRDRTYWRFRPLFSALHYDVELSYQENLVQQFIRELDAKVAYQGEDPSVTLGISQNANSIEIFPGKGGRAIDEQATARLLQDAMSSTASIAAVVASTSAELTPEQVALAEQRAEKFVGKSINFTYENRDYSLSDKELVSVLTLPTGYNLDLISTEVATLAAQIDRAPQEPEFEYNQATLAITKFSPPLNGQSLDITKTQSQILEALQTIENQTALTEETTEGRVPNPQIELAVSTTPPKQSLADTNNLGIKEKIGFGDSHYDHSIPNRIHNVAITTERISNVIVPPGAEFSFNKTLGDVSAETGYRSAYVIKNGQTELGDGGGVCQVSTTLFRSVLNAGLKVTRRLPHSYRVGYYELDRKPGIDATVYTGNTDFRFINDTPGHILIHAEADSKNLYMTVDIYGTSDGRTTEIKDHITWNPRPAPAPQYFPDPTLPAGKLVQIDWAASGISSSFINVIKDKDGNTIREDKYVSNYKPWAAKYRQGTGP